MSDPKLKQEHFQKLQKQYLGRLKDRFEILEKAIKGKDTKTIYEHYHQLKGSGQVYGYPFITHIGMAVVLLIKNNESPEKILELAEAGLLLMTKNYSRLLKGESALFEKTAEYEKILKVLPSDFLKGPS